MYIILTNSFKGLVEIVFADIQNPTNLILISDGAECVLIKRQFFIRHISSSFEIQLRKKVIFTLN